jgi:hypothetical protein
MSNPSGLHVPGGTEEVSVVARGDAAVGDAGNLHVAADAGEFQIRVTGLRRCTCGQYDANFGFAALARRDRKRRHADDRLAPWWSARA